MQCNSQIGEHKLNGRRPTCKSPSYVLTHMYTLTLINQVLYLTFCDLTVILDATLPSLSIALLIVT